MEWVALVDEGGAVVPILDAAPVADTGQPALPVRIISSLAGGGGGGGGVVQQGARDATVQSWNIRTTGGDTVAVAGPLTDAELRAADVVVADTDALLLDFDSGIGVVNQRAMGLAIPGAGGAVPAGHAATPVRIDPTGATAQPVTGPLTDAQLRASAVKAREDLAAMTWASARNIAPAANAVQATTGTLAAGDYDFDILLAVSDTVAVGKALVVEHRNAADSATLQNLGGCTPNGGAVQLALRRYTIAANERIRVVVGAVAGAATSLYVSAIGRRVS